MIFVKENVPFAEIKEYDIITFSMGKTTVTHRVEKVEKEAVIIDVKLRLEKRIKKNSIDLSHGDPTFERGYITLSTTLDQIVLGDHYVITEGPVIRYKLTNIDSSDPNVSIQKDAASLDATVKLDEHRLTARVTMTNDKFKNNRLSHTKIKINHIPIESLYIE